MEKDIIIHSDLLDSEIFNWIQSQAITLPYYWTESTGLKGIKDSPSFATTVFEDSEELRIKSNFYDLAMIPFIKMTSLYSINVKKLIRIRIGLITNFGTKIEHAPHIDWEFPHKTMLFYLTSNENASTSFHLDKKLDVDIVENRSVLFDGLISHSSSSPTKENKRIVINYNFID